MTISNNVTSEQVEKLFVAMAETNKGDRVWERAYRSHNEALQAAELMCVEVNANTDWEAVPVVEEMDLVTKI